MKQIVILGSTGSIGTQTLEVARWRGYEIVGLVAGKNSKLLLEQILEFKPKLVACDASIEKDVMAQLPKGTKLVDSLEVAAMQADTVVAAIPGIAGLEPTVAALQAGRQVALANKEAMVVAGPLVWEIARRHGATITPVDSEHSALFQCLVGEAKTNVDKLVLTASGGPFRKGPEDLSSVTPEQALKHPNWSMGHKVTLDSATLFNKGLEVLEAHFLFELPLSQIEVVIHPQSLIHSLVRFKDGNIKAQIGPHDMRLPIQYGIEYPQRPQIPLEPLPLLGTWELFEPDHERFPSLQLSYKAGEMGGVAPAALNAADEVAVEAFMQKKIKFTDIPKMLEKVLEHLDNTALTWESLRETDTWARQLLQ
ncbi:MAG: 1-deoxy-D-xylulose-5-phosphate reductoisomerase [Trueperaceae bacterium]